MTAGPWFDSYDWAGGREAMLRFGPASGLTVIVAPPLFEEANRTRALVVEVLRRLAGGGIGGVLPDLPGQGESEKDLTAIRLATWRDAFARAIAAVGERSHVVAIRGGALVSGGGAGLLHVAPVTGKTLVRDLLRARRAAALATGERPVADDLDAAGPPLLLAGNLIGRELLRDLTGAEPGRADRTITLFPDGVDRDRRLAPSRPPDANGDRPRFRPPWLASEPFADPELAVALADEIAAWVAS